MSEKGIIISLWILLIFLLVLIVFCIYGVLTSSNKYCYNHVTYLVGGRGTYTLAKDINNNNIPCN